MTSSKQLPSRILLYTMSPPSNDLDKLYDKAIASIHGASTDRSDNETVVEYGVQDLFKGKSPKAAANFTAKKLSGTENLFLGPGISRINPIKLENNLWKRMAEFVIKGIPNVRTNYEHYVLDGAIQQYNQKPNVRAKLKKTVIEIMGKNPFTHDIY